MVSEPTPSKSLSEVSSPITTLVHLKYDFFHVLSLPPSPTTTSSPIATTTNITISPLPNVSVGVSQPQASISLSTPLYTDSTATITTISTPIMIVNVSDTWAYDFGVIVGPRTFTASLSHDDNPDLVFGDDQEDF